MKTSFLFLLCFLIFSLATAQSVNQDVFPNNQFLDGEAGIAYTYGASLTGSLPTGAVIDGWEWEATYLGSNGSINGQSNLPFSAATTRKYTSNTTANSSNVSIIWSDQETPGIVFVTAILKYTELNATSPSYKSTTFPGFYINGVCPPNISGPASVQQCCQNPLTYTVSNPCDADDYVWTVPSNWTLQSGQNTRTITVIPPFSNTAATNTISCRVFRRASPLQSNKLGSINVTRFSPTVDITVAPNQTLNLCTGQQFTYSVPPTCNATNYNWTVPTGWSLQSGQGTRNIVATVAAGAQSGNIGLTVQHGSTLSQCVATDAQYVDVITSAPTPFLVQNNTLEFGYMFYHCNQWKFCANNSHNWMTGKVYPETQTMTWQISAPWHFKRPNGTSTRTISYTGLNYTQITDIISPAISCDNNGAGSTGGGTITVTVGNCVGSVQTVRTFQRENPIYCQGNFTCYPMDCACCTDGCDGQNPLRPAQEIQNEENVADEWVMEEHNEEESTFNQTTATELTTDEAVQVWVNDLVEIYPNPNTGIFYIQAKETIEAIRIFDIQGRVIYENNNNNNQLEINLNEQPSGIYTVQTISKNKISNSKVVLTK